MFLPVALALFILGAIVASFIGLLVSRLNTGEPIVIGRSRCDSCNAVLTSSSLIPIISYVTLKGRARCCGVHLSPSAPVTEFILGGLFVLVYCKVGLMLILPLILFSISTLVALVLYDLQHQILPPQLLATFLAASAVTGFISSASPGVFLATFFIAILIGATLALIHYLSRGRAMGLADAPLVFGLSLLLGPLALTGFIFSFWIGAIIGIVMLAGRPTGSRMGVEVPFAPFLAAGYLLAYFTQWNLFAFVVALR